MSAALMVLVALSALAQQTVTDGVRIRGALNGQLQSGMVRGDSTAKIATLDVSGNAYTREAFPALDQNLTFTNFIDNPGLALGAADSNANPLDTHRMRLGMLLIKAVLGGTGTVDTTCVATISVQIRTHLNNQSDSSSVFPIYRYGIVPAMQAILVAADTSVEGHLYSGVPITGVLATPSAQSSWSGEYTFYFSAKRNSHLNSIAVNGHTFYYPNGIAIPLSSLFGRDVYSPYTSVRVRLMRFQKGAASLAGGTLDIKVSLVGTPL